MSARLLPKGTTNYIRIGVISLLLLAVGEPTYRVLTNSQVTFKHADVEAGVFCNIQYGGLWESVECRKDDNFGLDLIEVDLLAKVWDYELNGKVGALSIERKGYSEGMEFIIRGELLDKEHSVKIPYPKG